MARSDLFRSRLRSVDLSALLFSLLLVVLAIAGGASRADALGQAVVRCAGLMAIGATLFLPAYRRLLDARGAFVILCAITFVAVSQFVPLPMELWSQLPGRAFFAGVSSALTPPPAWRWWTLSPDGSANALMSLIVPWSFLIVSTRMRRGTTKAMLSMILVLVIVSAVVQLMQMIGAGYLTPLVNIDLEAPSGVFANRNHQALFLAIGVVLSVTWGVEQSKDAQAGRRYWMLWGGIALALFFALNVMATGSRAGLLLVAIAIVMSIGIGLAAVGTRDGDSSLARMWVWLLGAAGLIGVVAVLLFFGLESDRAQSVRRLGEMSTIDDLRVRALPTVTHLVSQYFPVGSGLGTFDQVFRKEEPFGMLRVTYFNHAHNDFLEILIETGLLGGAVMVLGFVWWLLRSVSIWRSPNTPDNARARAGSAIVLLAGVASVPDYPARTPIIMAVLVLAALWITPVAKPRSSAREPDGGRALPS